MRSQPNVCHPIGDKLRSVAEEICHVIRDKLPDRVRTWLAGALLIGLVVATYLPALSGDWLWDDDLHVTANPTIIGPLGLQEIWTTAAANYFPLVLTNFWVQHALWGLDPWPYHLVTLLFHAGAGVLLWRVLLRLGVPGAWLGAALWALHPVQVESVAWICELKNTQSAVFFLLAVRSWLQSIEIGRVGRGLPPTSDFGVSGVKPDLQPNRCCAFAFLWTVAAILSKPSAVMLPVVFALVWWWRRGGMPRWRELLWLAPFFLLSAAAAFWTVWEQRVHSGATGPEWDVSWPGRFIIAGKVIWFYLGKLAWPHPLIFIYERWQIDATQPLAFLPLLAAGAGLILLWRTRTPAGRAAFLAAALFVTLLFPVLGFFDVFFFRYSYVGDHFQHLASMAPLALAAAGATVGWARLAAKTCSNPARESASSEGGALSPPRTACGADGAAPSEPGSWMSIKFASRRSARVAAALLLLGLGALTWRQCDVYASRETLWRSTVAANPQAVMAWLNLGDTLAKLQRHDEAIACFSRAAEINPNDPSAYNDLGCALIIVGRPDAAVPALERSIRLRPANAEAYNNLGNALRDLGRIPDAIARYEQALRLRPDYPEARNNLGCELAAAGRAGEALVHFREALRLQPDNPEAHGNLANALRSLGRLDAAFTHYARALRLKPDYPEAHQNYGLALVKAGRAADALAHFEAAVRLAPNMVEARLNLGTSFATAGRWPEAIAQFAAAVQSAPDHADARLKLALTLAAQGRLAESVSHFEHRLRLRPDSAEIRENFAQVLRALGRPRDALDQLEEAARLRDAAPPPRP
jgi:tetratricopeptide (TPR) repeat protein